MDKFKNIPILFETYRKFPDKEWYIFIDGDSFLFTANLLRYLRHKYNPVKEVYLGSQTSIENVDFAHGGTGYVISQAAARKAVIDNPNLEHAYEDFAVKDCCGDRVIAAMLKSIGVDLSNERERVQGEPWWGIRWGEHNWCNPILTFHHVSPAQIQDLWEFERGMEKKLNAGRNDNKFILHSDVYHHFVKPHLSSFEPDWENFSDDDWIKYPPSLPNGADPPTTTIEVEKIEDIDLREKWDKFLKRTKTELQAMEKRDKCAQVCREREKCLQWKWMKGKCALHEKMAFGARMTNTEGDRFDSGWLLDRIDGLRKRMPCEKGRMGGFPAEEKTGSGKGKGV